MKNCRKILIAVGESNDVLEHGLRLARDEKAWVTVLTVTPRYEGDLHLTGVRDPDRVLGAEASSKLAALRSLTESGPTPVKTRVLSGDITDRIVAVAAEERCDLIILGTKKRKGLLARVFGDNIVRKVIDRAACPVYVVGTSFEAAPEQSIPSPVAGYQPRAMKA